MIMEKIAIDFRCSDCNMIRRVDGELSCTVLAHLPVNWAVHDHGVVCDKCNGTDKTVLDRAIEARDSVEADLDFPVPRRVTQEPVDNHPDAVYAAQYVQTEKWLEEARSEWRAGFGLRPMSPSFLMDFMKRKTDQQHKADEAREKVSSLRSGQPEDVPELRRRPGESLDPPYTNASVPAANELCGDCGTKITDGTAWRPDPESKMFSRVHTKCLKERVKK